MRTPLQTYLNVNSNHLLPQMTGVLLTNICSLAWNKSSLPEWSTRTCTTYIATLDICFSMEKAGYKSFKLGMSKFSSPLEDTCLLRGGWRVLAEVHICPRAGVWTPLFWMNEWHTSDGLDLLNSTLTYHGCWRPTGAQTETPLVAAARLWWMVCCAFQ